MTPADVAIVDTAVRAVEALRERPEDRWDLRQELCLAVLEGRLTMAGVHQGAQLRGKQLVRDEAHHRAAERASARGTAKLMKTGPIWKPTWFPPHKKAVEFAWLACDGARLMHVKAVSRTSQVKKTSSE